MTSVALQGNFMDRSDLERLVGSAIGMPVLVLGDVMLDEYLWGAAERISPEAPVQVVDLTREELALGGAGNVARNLAALGARVTLLSAIGADPDGDLLLRHASGQGLGCEAVVRDPSRTTTKKTRVVAAHQHVVRIDRGSKGRLDQGVEARLVQQLETCSPEVKAIFVSDYLKGVVTPAVMRAAIDLGRRRGVPVVVDPKGTDYSKYRGATVLTPNRREAEAAARMSINDVASLVQAGEQLVGELELAALLITRSEQGVSLFERGRQPLHVPAVAREVFDVTGAGDTVLAVLGLGLAAGLGMPAASRLANLAAGIVVAKVGTSTVTGAELRLELGRSGEAERTKLLARADLAPILAAERARGHRVVFTNGCFDLLHVGHVKYLQRARRLGDLLVIGLNSDASVRRLKGPRRPLISEAERAHILSALDCVDYVVIFDEDTPLALIEAVSPDVLAKGADYTRETVVGHEVVEARGGRVELVPLVEDRSTSSIIEKVLRDYA